MICRDFLVWRFIMYRHIVFLTTALLLLSSAGQVMAQQADPSLFAWWKLDEGQGTLAADSSANGRNGTIRNPNGGLGTAGSVWVEDPERGMVIGFNGTDSTGGCVTTTAIIPAMTMENRFTWAFWAKQHTSQATNNDVILGNRYGGTTAPLQFVKFTPTRFECYNDDGAYANGINYMSIPNGVWVHHVLVKDGTSLTYYRDGARTLTNTMIKTVTANPFYMGADAYSGVVEAWQGYLSDVRLYTRALSAEEVSRMAGALKARKPNPANGALSVAMPLLQWAAGGTAVLHSVYLGT
ncbi:MAG: LamG domain-containing protein, partial [Planctomycetes bacterium]|nr:LamG domain-containing protein [Planctomycetota bacterium]